MQQQQKRQLGRIRPRSRQVTRGDLRVAVARLHRQCQANGYSTAELLAEIDPKAVVTPEMMGAEVSRRVNEALAGIRTHLANVRILGEHIATLAENTAAESVVLGAMIMAPEPEAEIDDAELDAIEAELDEREAQIAADIMEEEERPFEDGLGDDIMEEEERPFEDGLGDDIMEEEERPVDNDGA